ncbi:hypothetical protein [Paraburkholderia sp. SIMBA_053]
MNNLEIAERTNQHALFKELVSRRARLVWSLMPIGLIAYLS